MYESWFLVSLTISNAVLLCAAVGLYLIAAKGEFLLKLIALGIAVLAVYSFCSAWF